MTKCYSIIVKGRVQGVGYRYNTLKKALQYNLNGFVTNLPEGDVYIEIEGESADIEQFTIWCNSGPMLANVTGLEINEKELKGYNSFEIR